MSIENILPKKNKNRIYINSNDFDNPVEYAEMFANHMKKIGYNLDFTTASLENEIDKLISKHSRSRRFNNFMNSLFKNHWKSRLRFERYLTAYIGETLIRVYNGDWKGQYYGPDNPYGSNYYSTAITIGKFSFWPSHFIENYLTNGVKSTGTFYEYLYSKNVGSTGLSSRTGGLIEEIETNK